MTEAVVCCRTGGLPSLCDESRLPRIAGGGAFPALSGRVPGGSRMGGPCASAAYLFDALVQS
jgi:hypothetical protein